MLISGLIHMTDEQPLAAAVIPQLIEQITGPVSGLFVFHSGGIVSVHTPHSDVDIPVSFQRFQQISLVKRDSGTTCGQLPGYLAYYGICLLYTSLPII